MDILRPLGHRIAPQIITAPYSRASAGIRAERVSFKGYVLLLAGLSFRLLLRLTALAWRELRPPTRPEAPPAILTRKQLPHAPHFESRPPLPRVIYLPAGNGLDKYSLFG